MHANIGQAGKRDRQFAKVRPQYSCRVVRCGQYNLTLQLYCGLTLEFLSAPFGYNGKHLTCYQIWTWRQPLEILVIIRHADKPLTCRQIFNMQSNIGHAGKHWTCRQTLDMHTNIGHAGKHWPCRKILDMQESIGHTGKHWTCRKALYMEFLSVPFGHNGKYLTCNQIWT